MSKPRRRSFTGHITWLQSADERFERRKVIQGVRRSDEDIAFDCDYSDPEGRYSYTVSLCRTGRGVFEGQFTGGRFEEKNTGRVVAREYTNPFGFVLIGKWTENNAVDDWFAELLYDESRAKG